MTGADVLSKIGTQNLYSLGFNDFVPMPNSLTCKKRELGESTQLRIVLDNQDDRRSSSRIQALSIDVYIGDVEVAKDISDVEKILPIIRNYLEG